MRIKARIKRAVIVDLPGSDEVDIFIDSDIDWVGLREFTADDVKAVNLSFAKPNATVRSAPEKTVRDRRVSFEQWSREWPVKFFSGRDRAAGGGTLIMPDGQLIKQ